MLTGEGIGPEVVGAALDVLSSLDGLGRARFEVRQGPEPSPRADARGRLGAAETEFVEALFGAQGALLCGPRGGRFVYDLRRHFDLFCKLTPIRPMRSLLGSGVLRPEAAEVANLLLVRENVGGLYFGTQSAERDGAELAQVRHAFAYTRRGVERILGLACELAARRGGRLAVAVKSGGVPLVSALWRECATYLAEASGIDVEFLEIDNACYQVVADAARFDVLVSPNMFGDVLADVAALLLGSRGLSHSANFNGGSGAVYQTGHGAAFDLAGRDCANPVGQICALAMLLEESFGLIELAEAVRSGTESVLGEGWRTADTMAPGCTEVGTRELGKRIAECVHARASDAHS